MDLTTWPGRMELIHERPDVILDGAHNPSGVTVLRRALDTYYPHGHRYFIFGMMGDKDVSEVAQILFRDTDTIYTVLADNGTRAEKPDVLARRLHKRPFLWMISRLLSKRRSMRPDRMMWSLSAAPFILWAPSRQRASQRISYDT